MTSRLLLTVLLSSLVAGCASTQEDLSNVQPTGTGPLANCELPALKERGPVRHPLYVSGTFPDGQWMHQAHRKMSYKGEGIYQVVMDNEAGPVSFQFATMSWNPQYTAKGIKMTVGQEKQLNRGGFMKDTRVTIPSEGKYVWSIKVTGETDPLVTMISKCNP